MTKMTRLSVPLCLSSVQEYLSMKGKTQLNTANNAPGWSPARCLPIGANTPAGGPVRGDLLKSQLLISSTLSFPHEKISTYVSVMKSFCVEFHSLVIMCVRRVECRPSCLSVSLFCMFSTCTRWEVWKLFIVVKQTLGNIIMLSVQNKAVFLSLIVLWRIRSPNSLTW